MLLSRMTNMSIRYETADHRPTWNTCHCSSIATVAEQLGVSQRQVARMISSRELGSVKLGRRRLIPHEAITALLAEKAA
jgi:excisionase family DNA binding protein